MPHRLMRRRVRALVAAWLALLAGAAALRAADHVGRVTIGGVPVPGATIAAAQGDRRVVTISNDEGRFRLDLDEGTWTIRVEMPGFRPLARDVVVSADAPASEWALAALPLDELDDAVRLTAGEAGARAPALRFVGGPRDRAGTDAPVSATEVPEGATDAPVRRDAADGPAGRDAAGGAAPGLAEAVLFDPLGAADGVLVHGSVNNSAASPFAQSRAFGNNRPRLPWPYSLTAGTLLGHSAWDARPYSFLGRQAPRPDYQDVHWLTSFGGPVRLPGFRARATFFLGYQRTADSNASTQSALLPTILERDGNFSQTRDAFGQPVIVRDPETGIPFPGNVIPPERISPQAAALLGYYPEAAGEAAARLNHQVPIVSNRRQDSFQSRLSQTLSPGRTIQVTANYQRGTSDRTTLFGFSEAGRSSGVSTQTTWTQRLSPRASLRVTYDFTRQASRTEPAFAHVRNVSGEAGITGNNQDPQYWGPPRLTFSSGFAGLADASYADRRARTHAWSAQVSWTSQARHTLTFGADVRRHLLDVDEQQNARGTFGFTGVASGHDFADFLLGLPHTSAIAFGNADKAFRGTSIDAYVADDWRVRGGLTVNAGLRWEYESPITERLGRLVNLDVAPDFSAAAPVLATHPVGAITGRRYPASLVHPDRLGFQPRLGLAWRPRLTSSLVVRAGYGLYRTTNVYQSIATQMAQQPPLSTAGNLERHEGQPLTLAHGFPTGPAQAFNTFAVDPDFRPGLAHNWQVSVQRDLPVQSLTVMATYLGVTGTRLMQQMLPNTAPAGVPAPCAACPVGFVYLTSQGRSRRDALQLQVRRRLSSGFTATVDYTLAKATDNATSFGGAGGGIAQDWRDLEAEYGPSSFDQRHLVSTQVQYTTGARVFGGSVLDGTVGAIVRDWTVAAQFSTGSGLPLTPVSLAPVRGTGIAGPVRASLTGAPLDDIPDGYYLNPAAFAPPAPGEWGTAGRYSIVGPRTFSLDASVSRTFRLGGRRNLDWRLEATNVLNRVTYAGVNTIVTSPQFGLATQAGSMRRVRASIRVRL